MEQLLCQSKEANLLGFNRIKSLFGSFRLAYLPVLLTYFAYGASAIIGIAVIFFQKNTLSLTPAEVAAVGFWVGLPWGMKMVAGAASDYYPILGSRRKVYLILGAILSAGGYAYLAWAVQSKAAFLLSMVVIAVGYMVQDVVADALSVEVAENEEELAQVQALGRMALLVGSISVGYLGGWLAGIIGSRGVFAWAISLPFLVMLGALRVRTSPHRILAVVSSGSSASVLDGGKARLVLATGLSYALFGFVLEWFKVLFAQEIILLVSALVIVFILRRVGVSRGVAIAAFSIFCFRAVPGVGQGYSYWAIDKLGFDQNFLGVLAQVSSVLSLAGLIVFRKLITTRPVSFTLFWVTVLGSILYLPSIGLFYGANEWLGISPRTFAFIDTTISAPLGQLTMVPMLVLIARTAPKGGEATMFAIMASLMNLALSASELGTRYLNEFFAVSQQDYSNLGRLMVTALFLGLLPLGTIIVLRREERAVISAASDTKVLAPERIDPVKQDTAP